MIIFYQKNIAFYIYYIELRPNPANRGYCLWLVWTYYCGDISGPKLAHLCYICAIYVLYMCYICPIL